MQFAVPKNTEKYEWTQHAAFKMQQYGLTAQRILRVVKNPQRTEEGIVKNTIAVMQPASLRTKEGKRVWSQEIWTMYQLRHGAISKSQFPISKQIPNPKSQEQKEPNTRYKIQNTKYRIISAWRYPGVSPKRDPIPEEILRELEM
ncbi:MAG TPA: hypothetical protein VK254_04410 [Candidatus Bathyarchaeia archaeon]|nr:hypothetical protein [Candidatus Bathyarchaeia archaeon]